MTFIVFAGSTRPKSLNHYLATAMQQALQHEGVSVEEIELDDYPAPIYASEIETQQGIPETIQALAKKFLSAKGIFIASPEYNASVTPLLKNTLDWLSRIPTDQTGGQTVFKQAAFAIGGASPGGFGGYRGLIALKHILDLGLSAHVVPEMVSVPNANGVLNDDGSISDARVSAMLNATAKALIKHASLYV